MKILEKNIPIVNVTCVVCTSKFEANYNDFIIEQSFEMMYSHFSIIEKVSISCPCCYNKLYLDNSNVAESIYKFKKPFSS